MKKATKKKTTRRSQKAKIPKAKQTEQLVEQFRELRLRSFRDQFQEAAGRAATGVRRPLKTLGLIVAKGNSYCRRTGV